MSTTTINASKQTSTVSPRGTSWAGARDATSSNSHVDYTTTQTDYDFAVHEFWDRRRRRGQVRRSFFFFNIDFSETITAIDLQIYGVGTITNYGINSVRVAKSTAFGGNGGSAYTSTDFDNWTSLNTVPSPSEPIPYTTTGHTWVMEEGGNPTNTITLNSTAISDANSDRYLNLVLVGNTYDYPNISPTSSYINIASGIQFASTTLFPRLAITYTPAGYGNNVNGITTVSSVIGVEAANISSINSI